MAPRLMDLRQQYLHYINIILPASFTHPVKYNHCFARIILDWVFAGCWYQHLTKQTPAYKQLSEAQLSSAIQRMQHWLAAPELLVQDNEASLRYRKARS